MTAVRILMLTAVLSLIACSNVGELVLESKFSTKTASAEFGAHELPQTAIFDLKSLEDMTDAKFETEAAEISIDASGVVTLNTIPAGDRSYKIYIKGAASGNLVVTLDVKRNEIDSYAVKSWGKNALGVLLDGNDGNYITSPLTPTLIPSLKFKSISPGHAHVCGVTEDGKGYCWGNGANGRLGTNSTANGTSPQALDSTVRFKSIATVGASWLGSRGHTCGIAINGKVFCWGTNTYGQLGDNTTTDRFTPVPVNSSAVFSSLALATDSTCGLTMHGEIYCWGKGVGGELGQGNALNSSVPLLANGEYLSLATGIGGFAPSKNRIAPFIAGASWTAALPGISRTL